MARGARSALPRAASLAVLVVLLTPLASALAAQQSSESSLPPPPPGQPAQPEPLPPLQSPPDAATDAPTASPTPAEPTDDLGLDVTIGYGGRTPQTAWTPVSVSIEPTRLVVGTLALVSSHGGIQMLEQREVEAAAGSRKIYRFVVPPTDGVQVQLTETGADPVSVRLGADTTTGLIVGVLGESLPPAAPPVSSLAIGRIGEYVPVEPAWLEISPRALHSVGTLVAPLSELEALAPVARDNLATAVTAGMELVVVADRPGAIDLVAAGLSTSPATDAVTAAAPVTVQGSAGPTVETAAMLALTPADGARVLRVADVFPGPESSTDAVAVASRSGRGRISVVGVALGDGAIGRSARLWSHLLQPGTHLAAGGGTTPQERTLSLVEQALTQGDALATPSLPWLTAFLVGYVIVVGPLNAVVLWRFRRRELAWLTIPAITALFGAGAFAASAGAQPPVGISAAATYWIEGQGTEITASVVRAPTAGAHEVVLAGAGWDVISNQFGRSARVDRSSGNVRLALQLESLQVGTVVGWRSSDAPAPLRVTATAGAEGVTVDVANTSTATIADVKLRVAGALVEVGDLAAGASETVEVTGAELPRLDPYLDDFQDVRRGDGRPVLPQAMEVLIRYEALDGAPGLAWALGTVAEGGTAAPHADGRPTEDEGALVVVGAPIAASGDTLSPFAVRRDPFETAAFGGAWRPSPHAIEGPEAAFLRYRLPDGVDLATVRSQLDRSRHSPQIGDPGFGEFFFVDVWDVQAEQWVRLTEAFTEEQTADPAQFVTPLGELYVRATGEMFPFEFSGRGLAGDLLDPAEAR